MTTPEQPPTPQPTPAPTSDTPRSRPARSPWLAGLAIAVVAASGGAAISHVAWTESSTPTPRNIFGPGFGTGGNSNVPNLFQNGNTVPGGAPTSSGTRSAVATKVSSDLVDINTTLDGDAGAAAGTGIVVSSSGEVITNNHVIDEATRITATDIGNGKTYNARVVGYDRTSDVAVLQLENASGLATAPLGDSSTLHTGAAVVTIGNAGGAGGTPSVAGGSIVALGKSITASDAGGFPEQLKGLIKVNNALEPGDSGGPLVDSSGKVVGMDTAASTSFSFQSAAGQGFAIPINQVVSIAKQIVGGVHSASIHLGASAMLGVLIPTSGAESAPGGQPDTNNGASSVPGVSIEGTNPGSPAAKAGLSTGDTITAINGQTVTAASALIAILGEHRPGDSVQLTWTTSSGSSHTATLTLATGPAG
jgi:S1-C subfamily serine protease